MADFLSPEKLDALRKESPEIQQQVLDKYFPTLKLESPEVQKQVRVKYGLNVPRGTSPNTRPNAEIADMTPDELNALPFMAGKGTGIRQAPSPLKEKASEAADIAAPAIMALGGAAAGFASPVPGGAAVGGALGYAAGKNAAQAAKEMLGLRVPSSVGDVIARQPGIAAEAMLQEVAGPVANKLLSKAISPLSKQVGKSLAARELPQESTKLIDLFKKEGYPATPSDIAPNSKTLGIVESVLGYHPLSGDVLLKRNVAKMDQLMSIREKLIGKKSLGAPMELVTQEIKKTAREIVSKYGEKQTGKLNTLTAKFLQKTGEAGKSETGEKLGKALSKNLGTLREDVKGKYAALKEALPNAGDDVVPLSQDTYQTAQSLLNEEMSKAASQRDGKLIRTLKDFLPKEVKEEAAFGAGIDEAGNLIGSKTITKEPRLTWNGLNATRSDLQEKVRDIYNQSGGLATKESRVYSALAKKIDDAMGAYTDKIGGDIAGLHTAARESSKTLHEVFDKDVLKVMNVPVEDVLNRVVNRGEVTLIGQIKKAAGEEGLVPLRQGFFKQLLNSSKNKAGVLDPVKLQSNVTNMTEETISALATPTQKAMLEGLIKEGKKINNKYFNMKTLQFLDSLANKSEREIVGMIIKPNNVLQAKMINRLLPKDQVDNLVSEGLQSKILKMSGNGQYLPVSSAKAFNEHRETLKQIMDPERYKAVAEFMLLGQKANRVEQLAKNASQTGQVLVGSAIMADILRPGDFSDKSTRVGYGLIIPWLVAKGYTSPLAMKYITSAAKMNPDSQAAINLFMKGMAIYEMNKPAEKQPEGE